MRGFCARWQKVPLLSSQRPLVEDFTTWVAGPAQQLWMRRPRG
jgi:hypothetical protein